MTTQDQTPINVLLHGLGAIGSFYAFLLSRSPHVKLSVIARSNYTAVLKNGITIHSENHGSHVFHPHAVYSSPSEAVGNGESFDYVVVATKAVDLEGTVESLRGVVGDRTTVVVLQNGVGNEEVFHRGFGEGTVVLSGVIWVGATQTSPGIVTQHISEATTIGISFPQSHYTPTTQPTPSPKQQISLQIFTNLLTSANHPTTIANDIRTPRWKKCIWNAAWNSLTTLSGIDTHAWLSNPIAMRTTRRLMTEAIDVAIAVGIPEINHELVDELINRMLGFDETVWTSMYHDAKARRRLEVEVILGGIVKMGLGRNVNVPTLETLYALLLAIDGRIEKERGREKVGAMGVGATNVEETVEGI